MLVELGLEDVWSELRSFNPRGLAGDGLHGVTAAHGGMKSQHGFGLCATLLLRLNGAARFVCGRSSGTAVPSFL